MLFISLTFFLPCVAHIMFCILGLADCKHPITLFVACSFLSLYNMSSEPKSLQYLIQRVPVAVQRGNASAVLGTVTKDSLL